MTCGNRSREKKKVKGYTIKKGEIDKTVYVHNYKEMIKDMTPENKKPNSPDIWNKKPVASVKCPICKIDEKYSCDCRCHDEK